ncbi:MAG: LamG domain-containing protein [Candidatus Aenigmarchaeota archaeon]|nr:LamG domain-containing protein [Candidatus Aenigmarchaeota archaeon]
MHKAISTVIASILILMIVVALGGTTYLYVSGVFTGKTAATFEVIDSVNNTLIIRNSGTNPITSFSSITLDGNAVNIAVVPNIQGVVGYWSFNEGSGSTTDDNSGNKNVGTLGPSCPNCPAWQDGKFSKALSFDGVDDYVDAGNDVSLRPSDALTVTAWIKNRGGATTTEIINYRKDNVPDYTLYYIYRSFVLVNVNDGTTHGAGVASVYNGGDLPNEWKHVALVFSRADRTLKSYIDGVLQSSVGSTGGDYPLHVNAPNLDKLYFGSAKPGLRPADVLIDEVSIYNRALSGGEISALYSGLVTPGQLATIKPLASLSKGTHTLRLCTSSMCNTAILTII